MMSKPIPISDPDALIREGLAAEFLCISVRTLQAWRVQRKGPAFCAVGRAVRYRRRDLITWIEANLVPANTSANGDV